MTTALYPEHDLAAQSARLRQILNWLIPSCLVSALFYAAVAAIFSLPAVALLAGAVTIAWPVLIWLRRSIGRTPLSTIVLLLVLTIMVEIVLIGILLPAILPALVCAVIMAVALALPYVESTMLRRLNLIAWGAALLITVLARYLTVFDPLPQQATDIIVIFATSSVVAVSLLLLWQFQSRLTESLRQAHTANTALVHARAGLETQVAERTSALQTALADLQSRAVEQERLVAELTAQREVIRELSVPILPVDRQTLVMPLIGALDTVRIAQIQERALQAIEQARAHRLLLDITGVPMVDRQVALGLLNLVRAARLLGAEAELVGIRPEVAQSIVGLGLDLSKVRTHSDLQGSLSRG